MIRILHILKGMDCGGIETFIMNVYRNIDRKKIQFDFLVHTKNEKAFDKEITSLGGKIYSVPDRSEGIILNRIKLEEFFSTHTGYKIVHQHVSSLSYIEPLKVAKKFGIPIRIVHGHSTNQGGNKIHRYIHYLNQLVIQKYATHYFACSDASKKWMYGQKKLGTRYKLIKNGIDINRFIFNPETRKNMRKKLNIDEKFVIGHVGRFSHPKNHEFIIDVFREIHIRNKNAVLLLIGDGNLRNHIEDKVVQLGLTNSVIFTGIQSDVSPMLQAMDVFLFPSIYEGLGIAVIEAQSSGLPCIVSDQVPREALVTDNVEVVSLQSSPSQWADKVLRYNDKYDRKNTFSQIRLNGYDINEISEWLQNFYLRLGK